ncbi:hypothetical protein [Brevibacillus laterosporus]|uniref:hypothetical protein n=1 Tax=Brevibacillus laterosporus TaxID=1465 RepID=UPI0013154DF0|nr:hypothetical protein [Brevibacillus laterosporus]
MREEPIWFTIRIGLIIRKVSLFGSTIPATKTEEARNMTESEWAVQRNCNTDDPGYVDDPGH